MGGILLALGRLSRSPVLRTVSWVYIWLFRSVPLIVVLLFLYNFSALYHTLSIGVPFGPGFAHFDESRLATDTVVAVVGLSLNEAAYAAEVVRAGILSVDQGQHEAAAALGLPKRYQFARIVFPQSLRAIIPSYVNQLIGLVKSTSLVFYVSLLDLFGSVQSMGSTYPGDIVPLLLVATVWYVILTSVVSVVQFYVERYYSRGALRTVPPTPLQKLRAGLRPLRARVRREAAI
jgi:polar amino acid transport system permease protein